MELAEIEMADDETDEKRNQRHSMPEMEKQAIPIFDVCDLLAGAREAMLLHGNERYRLWITAKDKLILPK
jgi:hemin uptake protein HemP